METMISFVVPRHCVPMLSCGLSRLQKALIEHPARVRIASAPTGAGKTYAFLRAVIRDGAKVLFVVPTRRLAQNIASSLVADVRAHLSGSPHDADAFVAIWTSDERDRLRTLDPAIKVQQVRVEHVRTMHDFPHGKFVIATPESIAHLMVSGFRQHLQTPFTLRDLAFFDHIVFDEFHTIEPRGFGLAGSVARLVTAHPETGTRVSFLSATPIDIRPTLDVLGIGGHTVALLNEEVVTASPDRTDGMRALHGDVAFEFVRSSGSLADVVEQRIERVRHAVSEAGGGQAVFVYDSVQELMRDKERTAAVLDGIGIPLERRLALNSYDDTMTSSVEGYFSIGRGRDPRDFAVVVGTSSIEVGVTLGTRFMITDAGHGPASFVQRVGRVARGDVAGDVIVRVENQAAGRHSWFGPCLSRLGGGGSLDITTFQAAFLGKRGSELGSTRDVRDDNPRPASGLSMPARAVWNTSLFWVAMGRSVKLSVPQKRGILSLAPSRAGVLRAHLKTVERDGGPAGREWVRAIENEALRFRDIGAHVRVRTPTNEHRLPWRVYAANERLRYARQEVDKDGSVIVHIETELPFALSGDRSYVEERLHLLSPVDMICIEVPAKDALQCYLRRLRQDSNDPRTPGPRRPALAAAIDIVRLTQVLPVGDAAANVESPALVM